MSETGGEVGSLLTAVCALRDDLASVVLPLDLAGVDEARTERRRLLAQLEDYVIPRLTAIDAPLLAVVGGSTGAGKSTLVNSLVGAVVSRPGVLRPTTRSPVLIHSPADTEWFQGERILANLPRESGTGPGGQAESGGLRLVAADRIPAGVALIDAPDIDSVVATNRDLADQLLAAADLWLFVTTAARYADAVPWTLLRQAGERGTAVAVILDRVPAEAADEIRDHLGAMLQAQRLTAAPLFSIVESSLSDQGLLPEAVVESLRSWLAGLASDARARSVVVRHTLVGALQSIDDRTAEILLADRQQTEAAADLVAAADADYAAAVEAVRDGMADGTLLRGEVLARWQDFVGTGEFFRQVESGVARARDRIVAALTGKVPPTRDLGEALHTGVAAMVAAEVEAAAATTARAWRGLPAGLQLLAARPELAGPCATLHAEVDRLVRDWQGDVLDLVRGEGYDRRTKARVLAYGANGVGVVLMMVTFVHTGGLTGAEVGIAGGTAVICQKLLEAVFGDQAVRELAAKARRGLIERVEQLMFEERSRYLSAVEALSVPPGQGIRLARAAEAVRVAR